MEKKAWTVGELLGLSGSYWQCFALHAAVKLDIFTPIGDGERDIDELARELGCDARALGTLLNALTAMGLMEKTENRFRNTEPARTLLVKSSPRFVGHMIMHHFHLVDAWHRLPEAVRTGGQVRSKDIPEEERRESFLMGMFNIAMAIAPGLSKAIDLEGRRHLLDLGGGPGTHAIHFCLANQALKATIYDLPTTEPYAMRTVEKFGVSDRIDFAGGDYTKDEIPGKYDVAWLSQILHGEGPEGCQKIMNKTARALEPGGLILIHDFILNDSLDGPFFPALFSLNMLLNTESGRSYSQGQIMGMMKKAGLKNLRRLDFEGPTQSGIIAGER